MRGGARLCSWMRLQAGGSRVRFLMGSLGFVIDFILWPGGRLSLYQKWVPGVSFGSKGGQGIGLTTLPPSYADFLGTVGA